MPGAGGRRRSDNGVIDAGRGVSVPSKNAPMGVFSPEFDSKSAFLGI
jgi:hypothetical protein